MEKKSLLLRATLPIATLTVAVWGIHQAHAVLVPFCVALLLAFLLAPIHRFFLKLRFPEALALLTTAVLFAAPTLIGITLIALEARKLLHDLPAIETSLNDRLHLWAALPALSRFQLDQYLDQADSITELTGRLKESLGTSLGWLLRMTRDFLHAGVEICIVIVFGFLFLTFRSHFEVRFRALMPDKLRTFSDSARLMIEKFLYLRLGLALFVAILDFGVFKWAGVHYTILLASFFGLMTLIPVVGFFIALVPAVALTAATHPSLQGSILMFIGVGLVSTIESHLLTPKLLGKHLKINLPCTFAGLFIGEAIWGVWGILLSIPFLGLLRIILDSSAETRPWAQLIDEPEE